MLNKPKFFLKRIEGRVGSASACFSIRAIMRTVRSPSARARIGRPDRSLPQASRLPASRRGAGSPSRSPRSSTQPCLLQAILVSHEGPIRIERHVPGQEFVQAEIVALTCFDKRQHPVSHGSDDQDLLPNAASLETRGRQLGLGDALAVRTNEVEHWHCCSSSSQFALPAEALSCPTLW